MAQVMDANVRDICLHAHPLPEALEVNNRLAWHITGEQDRTTLRYRTPAKADQGDNLV